MLGIMPRCLDTSVVFLQGDDIGDGFFLAILAAHGELL